MRRQRHAGEERIVRRLLAPPVAVRHPPLLVAGVQVVRGDAAQLLRLEDRDRRRSPWSRRRGRIRRHVPRLRPRRRRVARRRRQRAEHAAAVVRRRVAELRARILRDCDRAQPALAADVEHAGLRIGRRAAVDVHAAARARRVPRAGVLRRPVLALAVGRRRRDEVRTHAALLRELERRVLDRRRVVDEIRLEQALLRVRRRLATESAASATSARPALRSAAPASRRSARSARR